MSEIILGEVFRPVMGKQEGVYFDVSDAGVMLIYNFRRPTADEIAQTASDRPFEIAFAERSGILWILSKCGSLSWTDAPYHPALSPNLTALQTPGETEGLGLSLIMTDASDATVKRVRLIGLGHEFSMKLIREIEELREKEFDSAAYSNSLQQVMALYRTRDLLGLAIARWRLR